MSNLFEAAVELPVKYSDKRMTLGWALNQSRAVRLDLEPRRYSPWSASVPDRPSPINAAEVIPSAYGFPSNRVHAGAFA